MCATPTGPDATVHCGLVTGHHEGEVLLEGESNHMCVSVDGWVRVYSACVHGMTRGGGGAERTMHAVFVYKYFDGAVLCSV